MIGVAIYHLLTQMLGGKRGKKQLTRYIHTNKRWLHSDDTELDPTWKRIKKAFEYDDVVITLGTGRLSRQEEDTLGLAGEHDYAVLDLKVQDNGERRMLLKNPWCDGLVWKGFGSTTTVDAEVYPPPSPTLPGPPDMSALSLSSTSSPPTTHKNNNPFVHMTGTFWISFEDVVQNFESLYLNWNPALFTDRQDHHFVWDVPGSAMRRSFAHNPQYCFTASSSGAVWVLLSRHFQDGELPIARNRANSQPGARNRADGACHSLGFTSICLFSSAGGHSVQMPDRPTHQSHFVDSPQTLMRYDVKAGTPYTVVVAQESLPLPKYTFTLSFFSRCPLSISKATPALQHFTEVEGSWARRNAGGNARTASFFHNPQYALVVPHPTAISLLLATDADDIPIHVDLVWASGQRVTALTVRDIVVSSGEYRRGCALAEIKAPQTIDAGAYTVVVSTFEPGQHANFVLRVGSNVPVTLRPVLSDAAGRLRTELSPVVFRVGDTGRKRARVAIARLTRVSVVARSGPLDGGPFSFSSSTNTLSATGALGSPVFAGSSSSSTGDPRSGAASPISIPCSVRVSFVYGSGPDAQVVGMTGEGEFADASVGLRTGEVDLDPDVARRMGGLWLVVDQMGTHREGQGILVDVLSDGRVSVEAWESADEY